MFHSFQTTQTQASQIIRRSEKSALAPQGARTEEDDPEPHMERRKRDRATGKPKITRCKMCRSQRTSDLQSRETRNPLHKHYIQVEGLVAAPKYILSEVDREAVSKHLEEHLPS